MQSALKRVHFSDSHQNYISAYRYVTKENTEVFHSSCDPNLDLVRSLQTSKANKALIKKTLFKTNCNWGKTNFEILQT